MKNLLLLIGLSLMVLGSYSQTSTNAKMKTIQVKSASTGEIADSILVIQITNIRDGVDRITIITPKETKNFNVKRNVFSSFEEYMIYDTYTDSNFKLVLNIEPDEAMIISVDIQYSKNSPIQKFYP